MATASAAPPSSLATRVAKGAVRAVQAARRNSLPSCRFLPTCSVYALEALDTHGPAKGSWLAVKRVGRCHPLGSHGYDPVPPTASNAPEPSPTPRNVNV